MNAMKHALLIVFFIAGLLLIGSHAHAVTYPSWDGKSDLEVADCILVTTSAEADSTHVYTLNPSNTQKISDAYLQYWGRVPRCSELQFHVDHNTTILRLKSWLASVSAGWFNNLRSSPYNNQTVSTANNEWFFIKDGVARRIPDILTGWSWGLMMSDKKSIPATVNSLFYKYAAIGAPLPFSGGIFASEIHAIWKDGKRDYSALPSKMATEISNAALGVSPSGEPTVKIFSDCTFGGSRYRGDPWPNLVDWSWMLRNPGCALAA